MAQMLFSNGNTHLEIMANANLFGSQCRLYDQALQQNTLTEHTHDCITIDC